MTPDMSRLQELVYDALNPPLWCFASRHKGHNADCLYCENPIAVSDGFVILPHNCPADGKSISEADRIAAEAFAMSTPATATSALFAYWRLGSWDAVRLYYDELAASGRIP